MLEEDTVIAERVNESKLEDANDRPSLSAFSRPLPRSPGQDPCLSPPWRLIPLSTHCAAPLCVEFCVKRTPISFLIETCCISTSFCPPFTTSPLASSPLRSDTSNHGR